MGNSSQENDSPNKWKAYLIVGYCFLFLMALFWSVDNSLVIILFGASIFFVFLGFYNRPLQEKFQFNEFTNQPGRSWFSHWINRRVSEPSFSKPPTKPAGHAAQQKLGKIIVLGVFGIVIMIIIGSILAGSDDLDSSTLYFQNGQNDYWSGNYDSARINYRRAWKSNPDYVEAIVGYGNTLSALQQMDSALIMYDKALEITPDYKEASYSKAFVYYNLQKYDQAIEVLNPVLANHQDYYDAMLLLGDAYYALQKYDDAISWYANAYENGQLRSQALCYIMAYIYDTKADYARAVPLYKEALEYDSSVVDIYKRLGELLQGEGGDFYRAKAVKLSQQQ